MKVTLILFTILFVCACKTTYQVNKDCISKLKSELNKDWTFIPDSGYYKSKIIWVIDSTKSYRDCIQLLDSNDVINIFGSPTKVHPTAKGYNRGRYVLEYAISPPCLPNDRYKGCVLYHFLFNSLNRVELTMIMDIAPTSNSH